MLAVGAIRDDDKGHVSVGIGVRAQGCGGVARMPLC